MPDLATAFLDAKMIAELREQQSSPESKARAARRREAYDAPRGLQPGAGLATIDEERTVHCFEPWLIVKAEPKREYAACKSLRREGFEAWYPAGRLIRQMPQRFLPSKTRHKKRHVLAEELRVPFPGYVFVRRLTKPSMAFQLQRLFELDGLSGLCMFGEHVAIAEDYVIQMLRFKEDIGAYDRWEVSMTAKEFGLADIRRSDAAKERWDKPPTVLGRLDTNQGGSLDLVEAFGRITRVIAATGDIEIPRSS